MSDRRTLLWAAALVTCIYSVLGLAGGCKSDRGDISGYETQPPRREAAYMHDDGVMYGPRNSAAPTPGGDDFAPPDRPVPGEPTSVPLPPLGDVEEDDPTMLQPTPVAQ